jgi:DNA-directed RNA polymerase subunit alpha
LGLSARTLNCLKRASIHKVGEVLEKSRPELLRIRNFGERSLDELMQKLEEAGIHHPQLHEDASAAEEAGTDAEAELVAIPDDTTDAEQE